ELGGDLFEPGDVTAPNPRRRLVPSECEGLRPLLRIDGGGADDELSQAPEGRPVAIIFHRLAHSDQRGGRVVVGQTQMSARNAKPVRDPGEQLVGDDLATAKDLGYLRL